MFSGGASSPIRKSIRAGVDSNDAGRRSLLWLVLAFIVYVGFLVAGWVQFTEIPDTDADYQLCLASAVIGTLGFVPFFIVPIVVSVRSKTVCGNATYRTKSSTGNC